MLIEDVELHISMQSPVCTAHLSVHFCNYNHMTNVLLEVFSLKKSEDLVEALHAHGAIVVGLGADAHVQMMDTVEVCAGLFEPPVSFFNFYQFLLETHVAYNSVPNGLR